MKKIVSALFVAIGLICIIAPEPKAEAQVLYSNRCCDASWVVRCIINPSPVNTICVCYGQGSGIVC